MTATIRELKKIEDDARYIKMLKHQEKSKDEIKKGWKTTYPRCPFCEREMEILYCNTPSLTEMLKAQRIGKEIPAEENHCRYLSFHCLCPGYQKIVENYTEDFYEKIIGVGKDTKIISLTRSNTGLRGVITKRKKELNNW